MRIEQITQALEVARTHSINKAAQNLFMAQSSLSSSINNLERELGQTIFSRSKNRLELTEFGAGFMAEAEEIRLHYQTILDMAGMNGIYGMDKFGVSVYYLLFATRAFSEMCNDYDRRGKHINFSFHENTRCEVIDDVSSGISELGVLTMPSTRKRQWLSLMDAYELEYHLLTNEPPHVTFGEHARLWKSNVDSIDVGFFKDQRVLVMEEKNELFQSIERELIQRFGFGSYLGVTDRGSFTSLLKNTDAYYIVTTNSHAYQDGSYYPDLRSIPVTGVGDFHLEIGYVKRKKAPLSPLAAEYVERLKKVLGL